MMMVMLMMLMTIVSRYVITGIAYAFLVGVVPAGPLLDALKFFEIILTPQVILSSPYCHKTIGIIVDMSPHWSSCMISYMIINISILMFEH